MAKRDLDPIHPGEILLEEFLRPLDISQYRLAKDTSVPQRRISDLLRGRFWRFSLDALVNIATVLGRREHVELEAA